jgi:hypothetical protein
MYLEPNKPTSDEFIIEKPPEALYNSAFAFVGQHYASLFSSDLPAGSHVNIAIKTTARDIILRANLIANWRLN